MTFLYIVLGVVVLFGIVAFRGAPYVPSHPRQVRAAFRELYMVTDKDVVVDVGSGDGLVLRIAAKQGARAIGYELNPMLVVISRVLSWRHPHVAVRFGDFWRTSLPGDTTLFYAFSVTRDTRKLERRFQQFADRQHRSVMVMMYGAPLSSEQQVGARGAHTLYKFVPRNQEIIPKTLQSEKA